MIRDIFFGRFQAVRPPALPRQNRPRLGLFLIPPISGNNLSVHFLKAFEEPCPFRNFLPEFLFRPALYKEHRFDLFKMKQGFVDTFWPFFLMAGSMPSVPKASRSFLRSLRTPP